MRYCVIGPIHPYRGGIAHHTALLCRRLSDRHSVDAVTFKRLYPSILFPGKSQTDSGKSDVEFHAEQLIDSINPVTWTQTADHIRASRPDYVLVQWWHPFFAPCLASVVSRVRPAKTIFICHNVLPHEANPLVKPLTLWALRQGDGFIVHSDEQKTTLESILPGSHVERTVLPEFSVFPRKGISRDEARSMLGVNGKVILFFGLVRKYKGLMDLIHAMELLRDDEITCLVVGEFYDSKDQYTSEIEKLELGKNIRVIDRYIPNDEVEPYFMAADVAVLPYVSSTQSAIVQVAYLFGLPVIATEVGGLPEAVDDNQTGLLVPPQNPQGLADAIRRYFDEGMYSRMSTAIRDNKDRFSWDRVIEAIEKLESAL